MPGVVPLSVNQSSEFGPWAMANGMEPGKRSRNSVTAPWGVIRPTAGEEPSSVNQRFPVGGRRGILGHSASSWDLELGDHGGDGGGAGRLGAGGRGRQCGQCCHYARPCLAAPAPRPRKVGLVPRQVAACTWWCFLHGGYSWYQQLAARPVRPGPSTR